jgi:YVTN family beta-propeller protein
MCLFVATCLVFSAAAFGRAMTGKGGPVKLYATIVMALFLGSGCAALPSLVKPALDDEGEVFVYLEPFPQESENLKFAIDRLSLVAGDGREFPLLLAMSDFHSNTVRRQRFLAAGRVPPGLYVGLSCGVVKATLRGEEGETALLIPEEPVKIPLSFEIGRKKAVVLSLSFRYAESVQSGFSFTPQFSLFVPGMPVSGLAGYTVNGGDNTVTVFDKKSGQVAAIIATGRGPETIALDQKARLAYLALGEEDAVEVIDITDGTFINRLSLKAGDGPREVSLTPDGRFLLTLNARSRTVSIIDPASPAELSRVQVGEGPRRLLVSRTGERCYVFNSRSNTISVIDIANSAIVATISTEPGPLMGQFNRKGDRLYVVHEGSPYLSVIDPSSLSVVKRVFVDYGISVIKTDTLTGLLYAYRDGDSQIEVFDPFSLIPVYYIPAVSGIVDMTIDSETNNLFIVSAEKNKLLSISLVSKKVVAEIDTGERPLWVAVMGQR